MAQPDPRASQTQGGDRTDVAKQEGAEVADDAKQQARATADTARQEAGQVMSEAQRHARDLAEDARHQLHDQARQQTDHLGGAIGQVGGRLRALAEGRPEEAGPVGEYTGRLADQVDGMAGRVQERGFDGMVDDLQDFARRRPGMFLAGALAAGFVTSRLARGAKDAGDEPASGSTWRSEGTATAATGRGSKPQAETDGMETDQPPLPPPSAAPLADEGAAVTDRPDPLSAGRSSGSTPGRRTQ